MKFIKIYDINVLACNILFLLVACTILSGCLTYSLSQKIGDGKDVSISYSNDEIIGFSKGIDSNKKEGWVFFGKNFDYLLSSGGDSIVSLLNDDSIDKKSLTARGEEQFVISQKGNAFSGSIYILYKNAPLIDGVRNSLKQHGFICHSNNNCELTVRFLSGSIHKKNTQQDNSKVLMFYQPVKIAFYKKSTSTSPAVAGALLYPVTLAVDIVTSPLQLISLPLVGIASMASMKAH